MNLIPEEELKRQGHLNLTPMIDFLFVLIVIFAIGAVTRSALNESDIHLVETQHREHPNSVEANAHVVDLTITKEGGYRWWDAGRHNLIDDPSKIRAELIQQQQDGFLPEDKENTKILLHIDQGAPWHAIAKLLIAVKDSGFQVHPVYEITDYTEAR